MTLCFLQPANAFFYYDNPFEEDIEVTAYVTKFYTHHQPSINMTSSLPTDFDSFSVTIPASEFVYINDTYDVTFEGDPVNYPWQDYVTVDTVYS